MQNSPKQATRVNKNLFEKYLQCTQRGTATHNYISPLRP